MNANKMPHHGEKWRFLIMSSSQLRLCVRALASDAPLGLLGLFILIASVLVFSVQSTLLWTLIFSWLIPLVILSGRQSIGCSMLLISFIIVKLWTEARGGLGQNFRPGNLTLIQAIPFTHNKFRNMDNRISLFVWPSHKRSKSLVGAVENY